MSEIVIVGGGVVGLSIAYELAGQGASVRVLEKSNFGQEASWAGAGMLPPGNLECARTPESVLRSFSYSIWPEWSERLQEETGIDIGYRNCGGLTICLSGIEDSLKDEIAWWHREGVIVEQLSRKELFQLESQLSEKISSVFRLPQMSQVRNPRYLKALVAGCHARGVELVSGELVTRFHIRNGRVVSVQGSNETYSAEHVCLASGAWSRALLEPINLNLDVHPVRGQIVLLSTKPGLFSHIVEVGPRYLVPRPDGRVLIGSTEESVGFEKRNTAEAIAELIAFGTSICPALKDATFERAWSGLRPGTASRIPFLSRVPEIENLTIAAGHFRSGLQMSPATAVLMKQLILNEPARIPIEPFSLLRDSSASEGLSINPVPNTFQ
ncbi:MAG: FAD-dependent oxidoreductase [Planctomycetaceae bacterium]